MDAALLIIACLFPAIALFGIGYLAGRHGHCPYRPTAPEEATTEPSRRP